MPANTVKYSSFFRLVSYLFHPVAMPLVTVVLYFVLNPHYTPTNAELAIIASVFIMTYLIPIIAVFLLLNMKLISSIHLRTTEDRKRPLIIIILLNITLIIRLLNHSCFYELYDFFFAISIALVTVYIALFAKLKISLHLLAMGGIVGFLLAISITNNQNYLLVIAIFLFLSGLVATARLMENAHTNKELSLGFFIGIFTQLIVFYYF